MIDCPQKKWQKKRQKRLPLSETIKKSVNSLIITLAIINTILIIAFISYMGQTAQKGYLLKQTQEKNDSLALKQKVLESKVIELGKYDYLQSSDAMKKMEPATKENYALTN